MRSRSWLLATLVALLLIPMFEPLGAQSSTGIMISEFRFRGPNGINDEFVELFNAGPTAVDIGGWLIRASNNPLNGPPNPTVGTRVIIPLGTVLERGCHYLAVNAGAGGYSGGVSGDRTYTTGFNDDGGVALTRADLSIVDQVGHGVNGAFGEGTRLPTLTTNVDRGTERLRSTTVGHVDTDNNAADFVEVVGNPEGQGSPCFVPPPTIYLPHDVQGPGATSPFPTGTPVVVRGVVTARKADGFFMQTEPGMVDGDASTSEGLFVSVSAGAPDEAQVGHLVEVYGSAAEFVPGGDWANSPRTQLNLVTSVMDLGESTMPEPYALTPAELSATGTLDQLERFEGMRVMVASLTAVTGTGAGLNEESIWTSDGAFYAVITGQARPFREAGVAAGYAVLPCQTGPCNIPIFDGNPQRLRVDSDALEGTATVDLSTGAVMANVTGPLDYEFHAYTLLSEATLSPVGGSAVAAAPVAPATQFTIASFHMPPAIDGEARLAKASLMVRTVLNNPDVLGVQQVEDLVVLQQLAAKIDEDALAAGGAAPQYSPWLFEGTDQEGLDVGVLVKTAGGRVSVTVEQVGDGNTFERLPVMLRALIQGPATLPQPVTVIVSSLRSLADVGSEGEAGVAAREQRRAQAEFLATYIQDRQLNDPNEAIVSIGDYNAFGFNDGYVDTVGTMLGTPAPEDQVAVASLDLVSPDLVNLGDFMAESERYSSLAYGNAQALEHVLVTWNLVGQYAGVVHPHVNADFPDMLRLDPTTPQRLSDRDPLVAYFTFPSDLTAPVFSFAPQDQQVEATSAAGASVTFDAPTATDNLDGDVSVACDPASGATHPLGNTEVTCTAADAAGNVASVSFTATVEDTTAPALVVPANVTQQASSAAGAVVNFTATATDAVTSSPVVTCAPVSGGAFPLGVTTVQCSASDDAGNSDDDSFTVTVVDTTAPALAVPANVTQQASSAAGAVVDFTATATDAVSSPVVTCAPASGSTFPVGVTTVQCSASDAAGNSTAGSFTVTITDPPAPPSTTIPGHMVGVGTAGGGSKKASFALDVRESASHVDRGSIVVKVGSHYFVAPVSAATFSNSLGFAPGRHPLSGTDTVKFSGSGWWNGHKGYKFEAVATDQGESRPSRDTFSVVVRAPNGTIVASTSGKLTSGNNESLR